MTRQDKRRFIHRVSGTTLEAVVASINRVLGLIETHISQVDAVGQRPDFKGKRLVNVGGMQDLTYLSSSATLLDVINKVNEIIAAFKE